MTPARKQQWIDALQSGKYRQGDSTLHHSFKRTYCCLGVYLKEVERVPNNILAFQPMPSDLEHEKSITKKQARFLPVQIINALASMNDRGVPFDVIAGFINENIKTT